MCCFVALTKMLTTVIQKYLELIKIEQDRQAVMTVIDSLREMLEQIGQPLLDITGARDPILSTMKEVFTHKVGQPLLDITGARDQILSTMKEVFTHKVFKPQKIRPQLKYFVFAVTRHECFVMGRQAGSEFFFI